MSRFRLASIAVLLGMAVQANAASMGPGTGISSPDGRIQVQVTVVEAGVQIAVRDDGVGIAAEDAARIFEPFYTTKGRGKGTGLGLAICRQLTAALGGTISVESESGKGSTFFIRLPRQGPPVAESRPRAAGGRA